MTEADQERAELLADLLQSAAWQRVVAPAVKRRLVELERRTMSARTIEDVRQFQGSWAVLRQVVNEPWEFFDVKREKGHALAVDEKGE